MSEMDQEIDEGDACEPRSLFQSFPDYDETYLQALIPLDDGKENSGMFYIDLFSKASSDKYMPSILNSDPFLKTVAELRSTLSYISFANMTGALQYEGAPQQYAIQAMLRFNEKYPYFCAVLIQRFWRAKRKGATIRDKSKFVHALIVRPSNGLTSFESQHRTQTINDVLAYCQNAQ